MSEIADAIAGLKTATNAATLLVSKYGITRDQAVDILAGPADGGPDGNGYFPLTNGAGNIVQVPGWGLISLAVGINQTVTDLIVRMSAAEAFMGEVASPHADAAAAEVSREGAVAAALAARLAAAQGFPSGFLDQSAYFTYGNGQIASPTVAANNPLQGSYATVAGEGAVWRTEANPESCGSFGSLGFFRGVPGKHVKVHGRVRCITDVSNGAVNPNTGVGLLPLKADFSLVEFIGGGGLGNLTVAMGWRDVAFDFTCPDRADPAFGVYYRPTAFYNVVGTASPLTPSTDTQGNAQFEWSRLEPEFL